MAKDYVKEWLEKKMTVGAKYGFKCAYCGCDIHLDGMHIDHIIPRSEFLDYHRRKSLREQGIREDDISNLNPSCQSCNLSKGIQTVDQFRNSLERVIDRLRYDTPHFSIAERYGMVIAKPKKVVFYFETISNG